MNDDDRQQKILIAAERLVAHYGVAKTTISDIAKEARVGVGTVYLEFTSKDDIVARLARERHARVIAAMQDAAQSPQPFEDRFKDMMNARVRAFVEMADDGAHATDLIHCGYRAVQDEFELFQSAQLDVVASFIQDAGTAGEFDVRDPDTAAATILRAYATFTPPLLYHQKFNNLFEELTLMHELLLSGLRRR